MRRTVLLPLAVTACATTAGTPTGMTAIYSPPVRLGGTGSMIFLPAPAPARNHADEVAVVAALHRLLDEDRAAGCLNPVLEASSINTALRNGWMKPDGRRRSPAEAHAAIVADQRESWHAANDDADMLPDALRTEIARAYADQVMAASRKTAAVLLLPADVPADIRLAGDCHARLGRPAIRGDWAFVARQSATAGHLYALRRDATGWTVVAHRFTFVS